MVPCALLAIFLWTLTGTASANCYWPNHQDRNAAYDSSSGYSDSPYQPLRSNGTASMCCAEWNDGAPAPYDPGLCIDYNDQLWRESCTDRSWNSSVCLLLCADGVDSSGAPYNATDRMITPCKDGSYCCDANNTQCCNAKEGFFLRDGRAVPVKPVSSMSTVMTATASSLSHAAGVPPAAPTSIPQHHDLGGGAVAGIVVGAVAGATIAVLLVVTLLWRRRRQRPQQQTMTQGDYKEVVQTSPEELDAATTFHENDATSVHELADPEVERKHELLNKQEAQEKGEAE